MTLRDLREAHPDAFMEQDWFDGERFMERESGAPLTMPAGLRTEPVDDVVPCAVDIAVAYLGSPNSIIWTRFSWTSDVDDLGQRIYVGGVGQAKKPGFQIHRHLEITGRWGFLVWA